MKTYNRARMAVAAALLAALSLTAVGTTVVASEAGHVKPLKNDQWPY